jgi:cytochrome P450
LRSDPSLLPGAVEELQRYDGPVQMNGRVATEEMELFGVPLRKGQLVRLCLGSANRDEAHYADADRLDITRTGIDHLGYGRGIHYCVGDEFGRFQARSALRALLDRGPNLRLAGDVAWLPSASNRGLATLPVQF